MKIKPFLRELFFRSPAARHFIGMASVISGRTTPLGVAHLNAFSDSRAIGPLQQPEALLLFSIVRTVIPKTIVEFGFYHGHSAFNFLQAMASDAYLFSYDISDESQRIANTNFSSYDRFRFLHKSQRDFLPSDIDYRMIDLLFFDASHDLQLNQQTFEAVVPALSEDSIICIHDTGLWNKKYCLDIHRKFIDEQGRNHWVDDISYAHQNDERMFVNWILDRHPAFQAVHLHSMHSLRHGLSVLQRKRHLKTA
jgi:predicted O-methyltransferase YrrM